jgi:hypothetical protein
MMRIADGLEGPLRVSYLEAVFRMRQRLPVSFLEKLLEQGRFDELVTFVLQDQGPFAGVMVSVRNSIVRAAGKEAARGAVELSAGTFDSYNPFAVQRLQESGMRLVRQMREQVREQVRGVVEDGLRAGQNPRAMAREIKGTIGLTRTQQRAVANYRRMLETGDRDALYRELRDKRFDGSVRQVVLGERTFTTKEIDERVAAYERHYLRYRAESIARTESIRALAEGQQLVWRQALQDGTIDGATRWWVVARDERTCDICMPIPRMNEKGVGLETPFQTPDGPMMHPPLHPHCRCTVFLKPL